MITGPSGVGKGTLIRGLLERIPELELSVSATTRAPRPGERDGPRLPLPDARGVRPAGRRRRLRRARHATRGTATGRSARSSSGCLRAGVPVVLEIEVQGARQVREAMPEATAGVHRPALARRAPCPPGRSGHRQRRTGRRAAANGRGRARRRSPSSPTSSSTTASRTPPNDWPRSCGAPWRGDGRRRPWRAMYRVARESRGRPPTVGQASSKTGSHPAPGTLTLGAPKKRKRVQ